MKLLRPVLHYESIGAFYADRPDADRLWSPELDFGVWWTEPWESHPPCRVSWVEHTGELYIMRQEPQRGPLNVIAEIEGRAAVEHVLYGWAEHCGPQGLRWLYRRLESFVSTYWCTACRFAGGHTEITNDPGEVCHRCGKRSWEPTPETIANAGRRRSLELVEKVSA